MISTAVKKRPSIPIKLPQLFPSVINIVIDRKNKYSSMIRNGVMWYNNLFVGFMFFHFDNGTKLIKNRESLKTE